jgi:non-heme chloroperoxidase
MYVGARYNKAVLMSAGPPIMVRSPNIPDGLAIEVFDGLPESLSTNGAQFYREIAAKSFYGFNRQGVERLDDVIENWWRRGGANGIKAFSEMDLTEDLKSIDANAGNAGGRRPDCSVQRRCPAPGQARQECHADALS